MQAQAYGRSNAARLESTRASSLANAQTSIDAAIFVQWVNAYAHNEPRLATFYFDRFRREFRPAVDAWIATNALHNPSAPLTPFAMPQYKLAATADANRLAEMAAQASEQAKAANQRGDNYVLGNRPVRVPPSSSPGSARNSRTCEIARRSSASAA